MSPKKASIDVEFKSYVSGYEESKKKLDELVESAKSGVSLDTSSTTADRKQFSEKSAIGKLANKFDLVGKKFLKPLAFILGGAGIFTGVLSTMKQIVSQSQVYASMVQLVFHPFVMMVNFLLLPVLKWLIPEVSEWLRWVTDNKDTLMSYGELLTDVLDLLKLIVSLNNPLDDMITNMTTISDTINNTDMSFGQKFATAFGVTIDSITNAIPGLSVAKSLLGPVGELAQTFVDSIYKLFIGESSIESVFKTIADKFISTLRTYIEAIPFVGSSLSETMFGTAENEINTALPSVSPLANDSMRASTIPNYEFILMNETPTSDNIHRVAESMQSIWRAKLNYI